MRATRVMKLREEEGESDDAISKGEGGEEEHD